MVIFWKVAKRHFHTVVRLGFCLFFTDILLKVAVIDGATAFHTSGNGSSLEVVILGLPKVVAQSCVGYPFVVLEREREREYPETFVL